MTVDKICCKICGADTSRVFSARVLKKYEVNYYYCNNCSFLQTEEPYWLEEAYRSVIGVEDTGVLKRNIMLSKQANVIINCLFNKNGKFLDYAGGYGIFVRLMRDIGFDFYWNDPYSKNVLSKGFEYNNIDKIDLITAFEVFEHFNDPLVEIEKMLNISKNILFSTRIFKGAPPNPAEWWYYSLNSGQHISLYSIKTLQFIANKYKLNLNTNYKSVHLLSTQRISNKYFIFLLNTSMFGLSNFLRLRMKSKTESDFQLLSK